MGELYSLPYRGLAGSNGGVGHDEIVVALESCGARNEVCIVPVDQLVYRLNVFRRHFVTSFMRKVLYMY
jgi:hypothetical protein